MRVHHTGRKARTLYATAVGAVMTAMTAASPALGEDDPFLWLEEIEGDKAIAWVKERNEHSLGLLASDPRYEPIRTEAEKILTATDRIPYGTYANGEVHNFWQDDTHVRGIWRKASLDSYKTDTPDWQTVLDLDALAEAEGENWVYKSPLSCLRPEHRRCIVRLSRGGKDAVVLREYDAVDKRFVEDGFTVPEGKQWSAWVDRDTLLIATEHGGGNLTTSGYPRQVRLWRRGTPLDEAKLVFESPEDDALAYPVTVHRPEGVSVFVLRVPEFFKQEVLAVEADGSTISLPLPADVDFQGTFDGRLLALLRSDWQVHEAAIPKGSLVSLDLEDLKAGRIDSLTTVVAPMQGVAIDEVSIGGEAVLVSLLDTVKGRLLAASPDGDGWAVRDVALPENGSVNVVTADAFSGVAMVNFEQFLAPDTLYLIDGESAPDAIKSLPARFDPEPYMTEQRFAVSKDGTRVPYFVVRAKDTVFDGTTPTLLYGYGGFEISITPSYLGPLSKEWLTRGGAYVVANIRGGGEFGPQWHQAALKFNREKAYDDFIAVAEDLIAKKLTSPRHLGIRGGSNGGLLVGATFTRRPDLFNAVICAVPLLDMLRYHKLLAGASWIGEYGDPEDPEMAAYIRSYSPYQNVSASGSYPEVFFFTSTKDDRVHPGHARKMAARMMQQGHPVIYYENIEGGHGGAANLKQRAKVTALEAVYLLRKLKDPES